LAKTWWTVFAVYADNEEGYVTHVEAIDVAAAKAKAYREADSVILIAGVVAGKVDSVEEPTSDVTPLRGRGHAITVMSVHAMPRKIVVPSKCPSCRADFRKPRAIIETDLACRMWEGHLTKTGDAVSAERDHSPRSRVDSTVEAARVRCSACKSFLWDGLRVEKA
jgi:hypothetical protein